LFRLYFSGAIEDHGACRLEGGQAHHAIHVMRLKEGDAVTLFDGRGVEYPAQIQRIERAELLLKVHGRREVSRESPLNVTVAQSISSGERMDYTVQKCVELGVTTIQPLTTQRSVVRLAAERAERRIAHWQGVAAGACEQCGRNVLPRVLPVKALLTWLGESAGAGEGARYVLAPGAVTRLRDLRRPSGAITLLVGPEGGFGDDESFAIRAAGFAPLALGPRVLRTETAAAAALAAMQALWGDA
jgi:16S rRNA (uracil1498-N3)-methyltransferase